MQPGKMNFSGPKLRSQRATLHKDCQTRKHLRNATAHHNFQVAPAEVSEVTAVHIGSSTVRTGGQNLNWQRMALLSVLFAMLLAMHPVQGRDRTRVDSAVSVKAWSCNLKQISERHLALQSQCTNPIAPSNRVPLLQMDMYA
jgi:hypothetical protein